MFLNAIESLKSDFTIYNVILYGYIPKNRFLNSNLRLILLRFE